MEDLVQQTKIKNIKYMQKNNFQPQPQLNWEKAQDLKCECGHRYFEEVFILKKFLKTTIEIPGEAIIPEDRIIPIAVLRCKSCGKIQEDLLPPQLREKQND